MSESNANNPQNIQENNNNQNQNTEENQGGFFNNFFVRMILMTLAFNIFSKILQGNSKAGYQNNDISSNNKNRDINNLQMKNFFLENSNNLFDVEFYISNKSNLYRPNFLNGNLKPILRFKDLNYSEENLNSTEYTKEVEIKFPIQKYKNLLLDFDVNLFDSNATKRNSTEFIERKNRIEKLYNAKVNEMLKKEELYLYSFIRIKNSDMKKDLNSFKDIEVLTSKINLFKFSEKLKNDIHQQNMLNDIETAEDNSDNNNDNLNAEKFANKKFLKNLYVKSEISFYVTKFSEREDKQSFQEYKIMKIEPAMDYEKFRFCPNNFLTDFWTMNTDLKFLMVDNEDFDNKKDLYSYFKIKINFNFLSSFYLKYMRAIEMNGELMENTFNIPSSKDMFVELLKNNSMSYLALLFTVNILHTIFSYMGFASDVSYYKNLKELDGVYTKYILFSLFRILITFIYVNLEDAHFIVKIELFVALLIETWKLRKIFSISFSFKFPFVHLEYKIKFASEQSQNHESEAINLMTKWLFMPISVLYLSYRIYYYKQTILSSYFKFFIQYLFFLFNLFGFVLMTPQIYLNYKLKSVEHMPVKALTYKFLNTIIDDLYAFAVKTTTLYRISCFKDDVIFVIFIVQMFIYRNNKRSEELVEVEIDKKIEKESKDLNNNNDNMDDNNNEEVNSTKKEKSD
jgi:hypothetical protein